jgi:hypothetical protein
VAIAPPWIALMTLVAILAPVIADLGAHRTTSTWTRD